MPSIMPKPASHPSPELAAAPDNQTGFWIRARRWTARLGMAGFLFFLVKGLLWLAIPAILAKKALEN
ncbi:MAG: hypothetical protein HBSAPP02_01430 [Phycisphaerae bacterium]|nr:MAG: hypothetical protein HRU71_04195 [Planctomycetia bacterium]RIK70965.1 MAG: hypothetical protein DCC66_03585 [Planctomycetota bacterium]GJQ25111.1 MAG: hypothetical protein HBSAPP02_01430 [Phycisphaerae bacterium]